MVCESYFSFCTTAPNIAAVANADYGVRRMAMTDEEYDEAMVAYEAAINEIARDICDWANAYQDSGEQDEDYDPPAVGFMAIFWSVAGDPAEDEIRGRSLAAELVKHYRPDLAERIDALFAAAPWRERPPLVEGTVRPEDVRILDDDWINGECPEAVRAQCSGKVYIFWPPAQIRTSRLSLRCVAARAINFRVARRLFAIDDKSE